MPYSTYAAAGKNKILNSNFDIWQRGTSKVLAVGDTYLADRFRTGMSAISSGTITVSQQTFTPGAAPVSGYEGQYFWRIAGASTPTGLSYLATDTTIEDVRTLAGQTVTFSFWAKSDINRNVDLAYIQYFGSGGSTTLQPTIGTVAVTTSWSRVSLTYTIPSVTGKTIGTGSAGVFRVYHPQNVNFTFDMWGVQMEAGSNVTAFALATGNPASELAACQRYYYRATAGNPYGLLGSLTGSTTGIALGNIKFPVTMRVIPTALDTSAMNTFYWESGANSGNTATAFTLGGSVSNTIGQLYITGTGKFVQGVVYDLFGNNNGTAFVGFSAEI
jgi:hypothetical protein